MEPARDIYETSYGLYSPLSDYRPGMGLIHYGGLPVPGMDDWSTTRPQRTYNQCPRLLNGLFPGDAAEKPAPVKSAAPRVPRLPKPPKPPKPPNYRYLTDEEIADILAAIKAEDITVKEWGIRFGWGSSVYIKFSPRRREIAGGKVHLEQITKLKKLLNIKEKEA